MRMYGQARRYGQGSSRASVGPGGPADSAFAKGAGDIDSLRARIGRFDRDSGTRAVSSSTLASSGNALARSDDVAFVLHALNAGSAAVAAQTICDLGAKLLDPAIGGALRRQGAVDKALERLADCIGEDNEAFDAAMVVLLHNELGANPEASTHHGVLLSRYLEVIVGVACRVVLKHVLRQRSLPQRAQAEACLLAEGASLHGTPEISAAARHAASDSPLRRRVKGRAAPEAAEGRPKSSVSLFRRSTSGAGRGPKSAAVSDARRTATWPAQQRDARDCAPPRSLPASWSNPVTDGAVRAAIARAAGVVRAARHGAVAPAGGRAEQAAATAATAESDVPAPRAFAASHGAAAGGDALAGALLDDAATRPARRIRRRQRAPAAPPNAACAVAASPRGAGAGGGASDEAEVAWAAVSVLALLANPEEGDGERSAQTAAETLAGLGSARARAHTAASAKEGISSCGGLLAVAGMLLTAADEAAGAPAAAERLRASATVVEHCTHEAPSAREQMLRPVRDGAEGARSLAQRLGAAAAASLRSLRAMPERASGAAATAAVLRVWLNLTHRCAAGVGAAERCPGLLAQFVGCAADAFFAYAAEEAGGHATLREWGLLAAAAAGGVGDAAGALARAVACDQLQYALGVLTNLVETSDGALGPLAEMQVALPAPAARWLRMRPSDAAAGSAAADVVLAAPGAAAVRVRASSLLAALCASHIRATGLGDDAGVEDAEIRPDQVVVAAYLAVLVGCVLDRGAACHASAGGELVRGLAAAPSAASPAAVTPQCSASSPTPQPRRRGASGGGGGESESEGDAEDGSGGAGAASLAERIASALGVPTAEVEGPLGKIARVLRAFVVMQSSAGVLTLEGARDVGRLIQRFEGTASNELLDTVRRLAREQGRDEEAALGDEPGRDASLPTPVKRGATAAQRRALHASPAGDAGSEVAGQRLLSSEQVSLAASSVAKALARECPEGGAAPSWLARDERASWSTPRRRALDRKRQRSARVSDLSEDEAHDEDGGVGEGDSGGGGTGAAAEEDGEGKGGSDALGRKTNTGGGPQEPPAAAAGAAAAAPQRSQPGLLAAGSPFIPRRKVRRSYGAHASRERVVVNSSDDDDGGSDFA